MANHKTELLELDGHIGAWIDSKTALPPPGSKVEILLCESPDGEDGAEAGTCIVHKDIESADAWRVEGQGLPKTLWVRYWRRVQ